MTFMTKPPTELIWRIKQFYANFTSHLLNISSIFVFYKSYVRTEVYSAYRNKIRKTRTVQKPKRDQGIKLK